MVAHDVEQSDAAVERRRVALLQKTALKLGVRGHAQATELEGQGRHRADGGGRGQLAGESRSRLDAMLTLEPQLDGQHARNLSAELKGLVTETSRVHDQNRLLVRQELSFLDHLMRVLSGTPQSGYSKTGSSATPQIANAVNAHA